MIYPPRLYKNSTRLLVADKDMDESGISRWSLIYSVGEEVDFPQKVITY